jgi:hypothetical protein
MSERVGEIVRVETGGGEGGGQICASLFQLRKFPPAISACYLR